MIQYAGRNPEGLGNRPKKEWPSGGEGLPIERLKPGSKLHEYVRSYLRERILASEDAMCQFYDRWTANERRVQAYIDLPDYEAMLKRMNDTGKPPAVTSITIPYSFATISTIVTYLIHTFAGRQPIFQVGSNKENSMEAARYMQTAIQYNADHIKLIRSLYQFFNDGELYGLGVMRTEWKSVQRRRTVWTMKQREVLGIPIPGTEHRVREKELRTVFEGTDVRCVDPFMFFPDPRVPMSEVNRRGEFAFWRNFEGKHALKTAGADGLIHWVEAIPDRQESDRRWSHSARSLRSDGEPHPGRAGFGDRHNLKDYIQIDQGSVEIIPAELGLGDGTRPEKWMFTLANGKQIIQAEPLDADHEMHPLVVSEPYTLGYGFGQAGISDYLGPIQDTVSWFINSHIHNVRATLNNMFVVDPSMIELQDLKNPAPGKLIRLKRASYGQDVRAALQQLDTSDITRAHIADLEVFLRVGDAMSAVNDNLRGIQAAGGRKTATEVRTSGEAAASRLASHAKLISAQAVTDLAEQMCINMQQYLTEEFLLQVVGQEGTQRMVTIAPEMLVGDFFFPTNDGTLPLDRIATLDIWKELYIGISQDPELRRQYNLPAMFEWLAELSGARNLEAFKMDKDQVAQDKVQSGNGVPLDEVMQGLGGGRAAQGMARGPG